MKISQKYKSLLLVCGVLSALLYIVSDTICSMVYPKYEYTDQAISELSAIGAPTARLWKSLTSLYSPLVIAFGAGVFWSAKKYTTRITGIMLFIYGFSGYSWWFFPMNMRGNIGSATDIGHLVLSGITVVLLTLILVFGSGANGRIFRIYSIVTLTIMLFFGALVASMAMKVAAQEPTPSMGLYERICVFAPLIWMAVFALILINKNKTISPTA